MQNGQNILQREHRKRELLDTASDLQCPAYFKMLHCWATWRARQSSPFYIDSDSLEKLAINL